MPTGFASRATGFASRATLLRLFGWSLILALLAGGVPTGREALARSGPVDRAASPRQAGAQTAGAPDAAAPAAQVVSVALFPDLSIAGVQNAVLPDSVPNDRQILLGSV